MSDNRFSALFPIGHRLFVRIAEKFCPFNTRTFQILVVVITATLLGVVLFLGWLSSRKTTEIVTTDFNQQQLVLAHHAAGQIEQHLQDLRKDLTLLAFSPAIQYFEHIAIGKRMEITFSSVREEGVVEIRYLSAREPQTHIINGDGYHTATHDPSDVSFLSWAAAPQNRDHTLTSEISPRINGGSYHSLIMVMARPVWQTSIDQTNPIPKNRFSGVLLFYIDTTAFIGKITADIRSGKTGYAWVIDEKGTFLYHPERDFTGKNAFEARKEKRPTISFDRINEIQKEKMMKGQEGTSWYVSGWHRGQQGEMQKLIAYAPIRLTPASPERIWSVAVVAPMSEVKDAVQSILIRQFSLQAVIVASILAGGVTLILILLNWSNSMEKEVDRKTLELKKSEQKYKSLVENAQDIIFTVDRNGKILTMNRSGSRIFRMTVEHLIGKNLGEICSGEDSAHVQIKAIEHVFQTKESRLIVYPVYIQGEEYWISTNFNALYDDARGYVFAVLGISRDVTERLKRQEQMFHTEKLASLGTLAAGVAHEINNPLAVILGFTDLLLEKTDPNSDFHDILKTVEKQGNNAKRVVQNLLSFARYREPRQEQIDVNNCIEEVLAVVENTLSLSKISIRRNLAARLVPVKGDSRELEQVFLNIINNAVSAMKGNGRGMLTVTTRPSGDQGIEIRFADTGHGVNKDHRSKIFDPLFTTKDVGEGTGLGLSVSYGIITKYGGTISFETKTADESHETGTTFIIRLPKAEVLSSEGQLA